MDRRAARRLAHRVAATWLQNLVDSGFDWELWCDEDEERAAAAMDGIIARHHRLGEPADGEREP